jgi:hypothetical protein
MPPLLAAALGLSLAVPAQAATRLLDLTVVGSALDGTVVTGSLTFDETLLDSFVSGFLDPGMGFESIDLTFGGQAFAIEDDQDFPNFPTLTVTSGFVTGIDYIVTEFDVPNPTAIDEPDVVTFFVSIEDDDGTTLSGRFVTSDTLAPIPLPAGLPLLLAGLGALGIVAHRRT